MMNSIFLYSDYKLFLNDWIQAQPKAGRGQLRKIAETLNVHPTFISHVFRGPKNLSLEQALRLARLLELTENEIDYFLLLVQYEVAGSSELKKNFKKQLVQMKEKASHLSHRFSPSEQLDEQTQAVFYSDWVYSAIRLLTSIEGENTPEKIAQSLRVELKKVKTILEFLLRHGLVVEKSGEYMLGKTSTHLPDDSPFIRQHHTNWRLKAIERYSDFDTKSELSFSAPLTLSKKDALVFREELINLIQKLKENVIVSESQELRCLNIDWIKIIP